MSRTLSAAGDGKNADRGQHAAGARVSIERWWWRIRSPLLMLAGIVLVAALRHTPVHPTSAALIYALLITLAAAIDGVRAPLVSGLIAVGYLAYAPYFPELQTPKPDARDLFLVVLTTVVASLVVGTLRDRLDSLTASLKDERARLDRTLGEKTDLMNAAAHELRTPLTVIVGYLSMLHEGSFGGPSLRWTAVLDTVMGKAQELAHLVDQMLLSARLDAGTLPIAIVELDLRQAVRDAVERLDPRATLLDAVVNYQLPSKSVLVEADPDHVAAILDNLLNNALTYSAAQPWVRVTVMEEGDPQVLIEDHGLGVPEEMRERIFERFVRVDNPTQPRPAGTGLGLAIGRDLAERHGGTLALLRSDPETGSIFTLRLRRRRPTVLSPTSERREPKHV